MEQFIIRKHEAGQKGLICCGIFPNRAWAKYAKIVAYDANAGQFWYADTQSHPLFKLNDSTWFAQDGKHPSAKAANKLFSLLWQALPKKTAFPIRQDALSWYECPMSFLSCC